MVLPSLVVTDGVADWVTDVEYFDREICQFLGLYNGLRCICWPLVFFLGTCSGHEMEVGAGEKLYC